MSDQAKRPCDCDTWCGDDPGIAAGRAEKCQWRKDRDRLEQEAADRRRRLVQMVNTMADEALAMGCVTLQGADVKFLRDCIVGKYC